MSFVASAKNGREVISSPGASDGRPSKILETKLTYIFTKPIQPYRFCVFIGLTKRSFSSIVLRFLIVLFPHPQPFDSIESMRRTMKQRVLSIICLLLLLSTSAFANVVTLPAQMDGFGIFTFKSSVGPAASKEAARAYAKDLKAKGFAYAMIKSHDGGSWGTVVNGKWVPCFSKDLVDAFHAEGMRVYSYFTARLTNDTSILNSVALAASTLDMGADGVIIDDLGLFGVKAPMWEKVFSLLRKEVDKRKGKILASSTFPHLMSLNKKLWGIAFHYSDFFLPQEYWMQFEAFEKGKRVTMQPQNALAYGQGQFDSILARYPDSHCELVPIGRTYGGNTDTKHIKKFIESASPWYRGAGLFVIEKEPKGGWKSLKDTIKAFKPGRTTTSLSAFNRINHPEKAITKQDKGKSKKETAKKSSQRNPHHLPSL